MKITILVDSEKSWFVPYGRKLSEILSSKHDVSYVHSTTDITTHSDILFLLSCIRLCPESVLSLNKSNVVIHPSDLPKGRGWSPVFWQIVEGKNEIAFTLFEANSEVDAGAYYFKDKITLTGYELNDEIRDIQGNKVIEMAQRYVEAFPMQPKEQVGEPTYYRKLVRADNQLRIDATIDEQFNLLRICDNERFPAFFYKDDRKYIIKIFDEA